MGTATAAPLTLHELDPDRVERDGYSASEIKAFRRDIPRYGPEALRRQRKGAVHEAAHAVLLEALGVGVRHVRLYAQFRRSDGSFVTVAGSCQPARKHNDARIHLAGAAAETIAFRRYRTEFCGNDLRKVRRQGEPVLPNLRAARDELRKRWAAVEAVADALEERVQLTGDEVRRIMRGARFDSRTEARSTPTGEALRRRRVSTYHDLPEGEEIERLRQQAITMGREMGRHPTARQRREYEAAWEVVRAAWQASLDRPRTGAHRSAATQLDNMELAR